MLGVVHRLGPKHAGTSLREKERTGRHIFEDNRGGSAVSSFSRLLVVFLVSKKPPLYEQKKSHPSQEPGRGSAREEDNTV